MQTIIIVFLIVAVTRMHFELNKLKAEVISCKESLGALNKTAAPANPDPGTPGL